jgi:hypothetical protein
MKLYVKLIVSHSSLANLPKCLSNNDYTIITDRASVVKNQLAATNGWTFVRAPEVCRPIDTMLCIEQPLIKF